MTIDCQVTRLGNGIRAATSRLPHVGSVAVGLWVGAGSRHESSGLAGISHFIEHLLFKGTKRLSARQLSEAIEGRGGTCNACTQEEQTCYYARTGEAQADRALEILADMYRHPRFAAADIEKERGVIVEEIMMYRDQPEQVVQDMLCEALWRGHDLGRPLIGTPETLKTMTRRQLLAYKARTYAPANTIFLCAGAVHHGDFVRHIRRLTRGLAAGRKPAWTRVLAASPQTRLSLKAKAIEQTQMALGFRIFGRFDRRRYALKLLSVILGENMSSRLFQRIRERNGLAYAISSATHLFADTGALVISAGLDRRRHGRALELIAAELKRLKEEPVRGRELARAKEYVIGHLNLNLETPYGHLLWLGDNLLNYGNPIAPDEVIGALQAVQPRDIQSLAGAIFRASKASLAWLSPEAGRAERARMGALLNAL